jgi:hypothetical protein
MTLDLPQEMPLMLVITSLIYTIQIALIYKRERHQSSGQKLETQNIGH